MTRNVVLSFLHNLTASKKLSDQLQTSKRSKENHNLFSIDDEIETPTSKTIEYYDINDNNKIIITNGKSLKKKTTKRTFFLRKSR